MGVNMNAQSADNHTASAEAKKACTPTAECAAKMGMSLEECKKVCNKVCNKTTQSTSVLSDVQTKLVANTEEGTAKKACCKSKKACSKKAGIQSDGSTLAEATEVAIDEATEKVATATVSSELSKTSEVPAKKACTKSDKKCCKSKKKAN